MAMIAVSDLTFGYEGSPDDIFEHVSFSVDSNWKLGFIGRNGKGKTTFLKLLLGKHEYQGAITTSVHFDYFPYEVSHEELESSAVELMEHWKEGTELWRVLREMDDLGIDGEVLYRPFQTLSHGERNKVMLAVLFSGENDFLLIDEPTNHLDAQSREVIKRYLSDKKGFILVSHDRDLLDACIDHVLVLNRQTIEIQVGNFSSWWENKERKDAFSLSENEKHKKEIGRLKEAADRVGRWAEQNEATKIGFDPIKEQRGNGTRPTIGKVTQKMESRAKNFERRIDREIEEKEGLLVDIEKPVDLKIMPLTYHKKLLVHCLDYSLSYEGASEELFSGLRFDIMAGDCVFLAGENGCGKSSLIKAILAHNAGNALPDGMKEAGTLQVGAGLVISYVMQDASFLHGTLKDFIREQSLDESLFLSILRQLDFERKQFTKRMEEYSEGQKKKVLLAASLLTPAHLYVWDEPLNYIDVFSRMQLEKLIAEFRPTMLLVEHDVRFREKLATKIIEM